MKINQGKIISHINSEILGYHLLAYYKAQVWKTCFTSLEMYSHIKITMFDL